MRHFSVLAVTAALLSATHVWAAGPVSVVAAENFYGDVAQQVGGADVSVTSILNNPDEDPHLFEASPSVARAMSVAHIVIYNGVGYDPWVAKLLGATRSADRRIIVVGELIGKKAGDNPHIWYDPTTMLAFAQTMADDLSTVDPAHREDYEKRLAHFRQSIGPLQVKIAMLRERLAGTPVTATEPVLGYMFAMLGMTVRNNSFQLAVMNNTEPSASDIAAFENDLKSRKVKLLAYNNQAFDPIAAHMMELAKVSYIPVVGAAETEPPGKSYQEWMAAELNALDHALPH